MRPYDILSPRAKNARRSRRIEGVFAAGPVPNYGRKGFGGPFFFPGRISSKGPASMRDASDLHLILYRCPRFTSGPEALHLSAFLPLCPLDSETSVYVSSFFYWVGSHPPPVWYVFHMRSYCHSFVFCCDERYNQKDCQNFRSLCIWFDNIFILVNGCFPFKKIIWSPFWWKICKMTLYIHAVIHDIFVYIALCAEVCFIYATVLKRLLFFVLILYMFHYLYYLLLT